MNDEPEQSEAQGVPLKQPVVSVRHLTIEAGGRALVRGASFEVMPCSVVLIVGRSGSGKSVLLKVLAGLIDEDSPGFHITGKAAVAGVDVVVSGASTRLRGKTGIVFQEFGLFDEFTPLRNLEFAADHAASKLEGGQAAVERLGKELDFPLDLPVRFASPGQRQRMALGRTLAFNPSSVIFFDEPTSGLDPANGARVAEKIRSIAAESGRACVVVTHDYPLLLPAADKVLWIDDATGAVSGVPGSDLERLAASWTSEPQPRAGRAGAWFYDASVAVATAPVAVVERVLEAVRFAIPFPPRIGWGLRYFLHYMNLVASPSAFLYVGLSGAITGFVATWFTYEYFPYKEFTEPLLIDDVLGSLGYMLYRVLVPVLATVLVAARCGSAVAADVGNRSWSGSVEAMKSFGVEPRRYLYTGVIWAFLIGVPLMCAGAFLASALTSLFAFTIKYPDKPPPFWELHFHKFIAESGFPYEGTWWLLVKVLACAAAVAVISFGKGYSQKKSLVSVNSGITSTVIWATMAVLLVHLVFAFFEFSI